jgi:hypothetical protein
MGEERKVYGISVGKPEGKRPLGRQRNGWEDRIRLNFTVGACEWSGFRWLRIWTGEGLL